MEVQTDRLTLSLWSYLSYWTSYYSYEYSSLTFGQVCGIKESCEFTDYIYKERRWGPWIAAQSQIESHFYFKYGFLSHSTYETTV